MSGTEIKAKHDLVKVVESYGVVLKPNSAHEIMGLCPFHKEKTPSFSVNPEKQVFFCHGCHATGDVVHFVSRMDNIPIGAALVKLTPEHLRERPYIPPSTPPKKSASDQSLAVASPGEKKAEYKLTDSYTYTDEYGVELFQIDKFVAIVDGKRKKKFTQKHKGEKCEWVYSMDGVRRVLYNLPNVKKSPVVVLCEGEKDCETVNKLGLVATTNPGGAEKWLDSYSDYLVGKDLIILGDNDEAGRLHVKKVLSAVSGKVKTARVCYMPEGKDVTEFKEKLVEKGKTDEEFCNELEKVVSSALPLEKGIDLPIYSMSQLEHIYRNEVQRDDNYFDFGKLLPTLGRKVRPATGGDLITIMAATGVGKTFLAQLLMIACSPIKALFFELELSERLTFERFAGMDTTINGREIERAYKEGRSVPWSPAKMGHIYTCPLPKMSPEKIETFIKQSELIIGERPKIVVVDYAQLVAGKGETRYEKNSNTAEELRIVAKSTNTAIILTSQVARSKEEGQYKEVSMQDAKESGSIENSSSLLLGLWPDREVEGKLYCKVLKDTKEPSAGTLVTCMRKGMQLSEVSEVEVNEDLI